MIELVHRSNRIRALGPIVVTVSSLAVLFLSGATAVQAQTYTLSTIATFNGFGNGYYPSAALTIDSKGNLYGTTASGGTDNYGTVFEIAAGTHALNTIATFNGLGNGSEPSTALTLDSAGNLFGTTDTGGAFNYGTVFEIAAGTDTMSTLVTFKNATTGLGPRGSLTFDSSGNLYGTTYGGGANDDGTVYKISAGTHSLTTIASFDGTDGSQPFSKVTIDAGGDIFGTAAFGGDSAMNSEQGDGTVFEIAAGSNTISTLATFNGTNGTTPNPGLVADASGNLYGATNVGGTYGQGTIFKIAAGTGVLTTMLSFNYADGAEPAGGLSIDSKGDLFGTTGAGGTSDDGTVFEIAAGTNAVTTLASFQGMNGIAPRDSVVFDNAGNIYGTTYFGGNLAANNGYGYGTVFELTPKGSASAPEPGTFALLALILPSPWRFSSSLQGRRKITIT